MRFRANLPKERYSNLLIYFPLFYAMYFSYFSASKSFFHDNILFHEILPQAELKDFPLLNITQCKKIDFSDISFPYYDSFVHYYHINPETIPLVYTGLDWSGGVTPSYAATYFLENINIYHIKNGYIGDNKLVIADYNHYIDASLTKKRF